MEFSDYIALLAKCMPLLIKGVLMTLRILVGAAALSILLGTLMGALSCNQLKLPLLSKVVELFTFTLRAIPFFVQLLLVYFVVPQLVGISLNPLSASILALGLCSSGYVAQIVRGGINAIPLQQWESCFVLGYGKWQSFRYVILPQVGRQILPTLNNELESLLKSTSIAASIGMLELTRIGMNLVSKEMEPIPIYLTIAAIYMGLSGLLAFISRKIERRFYLCY